MNLKGKRAIVTGSSRGIGFEIARLFCERGASVVICSTKESTAQSVADQLASTYSTQCIGVGLDISDASSVQGMIAKTLETFGGIDVLVNNAGITKDNLLLRLSEEDWNTVIQTNLNSVFHTTKAVLRPMMKQKRGTIINMASVVGVIGNPGQSNYAASKAGMIGFSKSIAKEYAKKNIVVNVVAPGFIETDMTKELPEDYLSSVQEQVPMGRLGHVSEIAELTAFLASDAAGYMTGQVFKIDGGLSM